MFLAKFRWCVNGCSWHTVLSTFPYFQIFPNYSEENAAESLQVSLPTSRPHAGCFASCFPAASLLFLLLPPTFSSHSPPLPPPPATPLGFQLQKPKLSRMQSKMRLTTAEAWESKYFESLTSSVVDR